MASDNADDGRALHRADNDFLAEVGITQSSSSIHEQGRDRDRPSWARLVKIRLPERRKPIQAGGSRAFFVSGVPIGFD